MKLKLIIITGFSLACTLLMSAQLNAFGLGAYGTTSKGSTAWTYHIDESPNSDLNSTDSKMGGGLVLDTNLAYDRLFNYRLNIGFTKINLDNEKSTKDINGRDYHLYNNFGFGLVRTEEIRLWIGPQIGLGFIKGEYDLSGGQDNTFWTIFFSGGLVAGLNVNLGDIITLGFDGGYRIKKHYGTADYGTLSFGVTGKEKELFANVSFILRINDNYSSK